MTLNPKKNLWVRAIIVITAPIWIFPFVVFLLLFAPLATLWHSFD